MYGIDAADRSARIRKEEVALAFCEREKIESFEPTCLSARAYKLVGRWAVNEDLDQRPLVHALKSKQERTVHSTLLPCTAGSYQLTSLSDSLAGLP